MINNYSGDRRWIKRAVSKKYFRTRMTRMIANRIYFKSANSQHLRHLRSGYRFDTSSSAI